jgi:hypothetical protein
MNVLPLFAVALAYVAVRRIARRGAGDLATEPGARGS